MDEDEIKLLKEETIKDTKRGLFFNLIVGVGFVILYISYQILSGKIDFNNIFGDKYLPIDYKPKSFIEKLNEKIINIKEYLIFFSILIVLLIFVHKSNLDWENDYLQRRNKTKSKTKISKLETILEENESEEKDKNE